MKENKVPQAQVDAPELKELIIQGDTYLTTFTRKYEGRHNWIKPDKKKVISFIPGTIREVVVRPGDYVKAEQKLLVMEAMRMMNTIHAPMTGKIKSVLVKVGECLPKGSVLVEFE